MGLPSSSKMDGPSHWNPPKEPQLLLLLLPSDTMDDLLMISTWSFTGEALGLVFLLISEKSVVVLPLLEGLPTAFHALSGFGLLMIGMPVKLLSSSVYNGMFVRDMHPLPYRLQGLTLALLLFYMVEARLASQTLQPIKIHHLPFAVVAPFLSCVCICVCCYSIKAISNNMLLWTAHQTLHLHVFYG